MGGAVHDGIWLLRQLRTKVPVIAVTGYRERDQEFRSLGFVEVLVKPIEIATLPAVVRSAIA